MDKQQVLLYTYTGMTCQLSVYTAQLLALHVHCPTDKDLWGTDSASPHPHPLT